MAMEALPRKTHQEVINELVPLAGALVFDIGCGEGRITRLIATSGARVTGIDPGPQQIERALAQPNVAGEAYVVGSAEKLDAASGSADVVVFFNSLHHVPAAAMDRALSEAIRVLRPGGWLYIAEPLPEGPQYELARPYNDEAGVRLEAYEAIGRATSRGLSAEQEIRYVADGKQASFESYRENAVSISPSRSEYFQRHDAEMRARFESLGERRSDGWHFPQPVRVNLLRKI